uniref:NADH-ubiquinone oxidoreductase chain 5 n=1 Tax=Gmelinoides fasciatus TaxID=686704 RepID=A0A1L5BW58_9CRUS|nr:NADH dehydrogenase subunit 5 [Gmelinoides fasciatus]APL97190.1 NADH dehydrogenase subunit 5 [Gmelinoides fasciatus]
MMVGSKVYSLLSVVLLAMSVVWGLSGLVSGLWGCSFVIEWELLELSSVMISMSLVFDWMSLFFLSSVCLISSCVMKYSEYYMEGEVNYLRFSYLLVVFVGSMWFLIISPNMVSLLLGWDGLGLTSYALVIFYQSDISCNAGMLTILSNRIGDVAILVSIGLMYSLGQFDFFKVWGGFNSALVGLLLLAACTKSAQVPFSSWLPAAMAAPTPVSALVHSSTLVTAGVYLLIRFNNELQSSGLSSIMLVLGSSTMVMAGLGALVESDLKKVIAFSTLSQLGLMIIIVSSGMSELAFFHLITHAMFKSSLFMCVGFMIHSVKGWQDSRSMSGFQLSSPGLGLVLGGSNLALCGFPFLAGFYSKDMMLESMLSMNLNWLTMGLMVMGVGLTVGYSFRILRISSSSSSVLSSVSSASDLSSLVMKSVVVLFLMSVMSGFFFFWICSPVMAIPVLTMKSKFSVVMISVLSGLGMFKGLDKNPGFSKKGFKVLESFSYNMWFMGFLSTKFVSAWILSSGSQSVKVLELGWFEYYGGLGGSRVFIWLSGLGQAAQKNNMVSSYLVMSVLVVGFCFFI